MHEPEVGVANVRNTAFAQSKGALIAFLDDDQAALAGWLADLLAAQKRLDADVVFGQVQARVLKAKVAHRPCLEWFFSREGPAQEHVIDAYFGCGNSLLRRASLPCDPPFSSLRNFIGGEDDMLFGVMQKPTPAFAGRLRPSSTKARNQSAKI